MSKNLSVSRVNLMVDSHAVINCIVRRFFEFDMNCADPNGWFCDKELKNDPVVGEFLLDSDKSTVNNNVHNILSRLKSSGILVGMSSKRNHGGKNHNSVYSLNPLYWESEDVRGRGVSDVTTKMIRKYNTFRNFERKCYLNKKEMNEQELL